MPSEDEEDMLDLAFGLTRTSRLGCQITIAEGLDGLRVSSLWRNAKHDDGLEDMDGANSLFERLKATCVEDWKRYTHHDFVAGIADGTLPEAAFRHYLIQDYLFLIQFARLMRSRSHKSDTLADMRQAGAGMSAIRHGDGIACRVLPKSSSE